MISFGAKIVKALIRAYTYRYRKRQLSLSRSLRFKNTPYKAPKSYIHRVLTFDGIRAEILSRKLCSHERTIVHFHGGGATVGMNNFYRRIARKICDLTGYPVISIDYRTGKDLVHPALLDDCYRAYKRMIDEGLNPATVIMIGDSMGANLMFSVCFRLRDEGVALPVGTIAVSPYVDLSASGDSYRKNCYADPSYSLPKNQKFEEREQAIRRISPYCGNTDRQNPYLSPAFGDYTGFPSALIQVGSCELSESDSALLYDRMLRTGVPVTLHKYDGMFHDFQYFAPFLKESKVAWSEIRRFVKKL